MKEIKFPYVRFSVTPSGIKPPHYIYRPVIPLELILGKELVEFDALIDSGADECTFPGSVAEELGFDLYKGEERLFTGIGGSTLGYGHKTQLIIGEVKILVDVYYSHEWNRMPFGLLGQASFFSHFDIQFRYRAKEVVLRH